MAHLRKKNSNKSESIIQDIKTLEHEAIDYVKTLTWAQIEEWQKDNEYIIGGYRRFDFQHSKFRMNEMLKV